MKQTSFGSGKKLIVYHANWSCYGRNYQVKDLPINFISDVNYCFLDLKPNSNGFYVPTFSDPWADFKRYANPAESVAPIDHQNPAQPNEYFGNLGQFLKLRQSGLKFNFGISIGGWSFSTHFSDAVKSVEARLAFVETLIGILDRFPGLINRVDLDWEHISPAGANHGKEGNVSRAEDGSNFEHFLILLRNHLDHSAHNHVTITACISGVPSMLSALPLKTMAQILESINVMTYDFSSSSYGPCLAGHHTNLYSTPYAPNSIDKVVTYLLSQGVPSEKIVIGAALYSRGFANTDGLGKPSKGLVSDKSWEEGVCDYKDLPKPGALEYYDEQAQAHYSYDKEKKILNSYDSVKSIQEKCKYVWEKNLKGIIVWESSGDFPPSHERSILAALYQGLSK